MMWMRLLDICDFQGGSQPPKEEWSFAEQEGYIRMLQIRDFTQSEKVTPEYIKISNCIKTCTEDDVLIARYGASIGKVLTGIAGAYNVAIMRTIPDTDIIRKRFLYYYLKSSYFQYAILNVGSRAAQAGFNKTDLAKLEITCPELSKQDKIVKILEKIESIIQKRKDQLNALDYIIKARFVEMFESMKETCEVGYYIKSLIAGKSLAGESECENKVLKTGAVSFDYFDSRQVKNLPNDYKPQKQHLVNVGDIIISRMNTAELTGAAAYVWKVPKNVYIPDRLWKAVLGEKSNPIFVWQMLIQPSTKEQIQKECSGTSGSMKNISKAGMLGIKVKKVPYDMQNEFADFVCQVDKSKLLSLIKLLE